MVILPADVKLQAITVFIPVSLPETGVHNDSQIAKVVRETSPRPSHLDPVFFNLLPVLVKHNDAERLKVAVPDQVLALVLLLGRQSGVQPLPRLRPRRIQRVPFLLLCLYLALLLLLLLGPLLPPVVPRRFFCLGQLLPRPCCCCSSPSAIRR
ncbi:hypothetical protein VTK73DRAFT_5018 [Phialemonium thermophilum]|uniref:Uncharacterized protein n=1 Tax=Phialemonium thermophilum TaxID=223376 RepID=A0ABR3V5I9_9PEZI